jgi:hypothetical protein
MENKKAAAAIRELREFIGLTQTEFAKLYLKRSLNTQQIYERRGTPPAMVMQQLVELARSKGRNDLAATLKLGLQDNWPEKVLNELRDMPAIVKKR